MWLDTTPAARTRAREAFRATVNTPTQLRVAGVRLAVSATIVDISANGCRLRSWIVMDRGAKLEFDWDSGAGTVAFTGTIVTRTSSKSGPVYEYGVQFAGMDRSKQDALARQLTEFQRRKIVKHPEPKGGGDAGSDVQRRRAYRARTEFPVNVRLESSARTFDATAIDVSAGGMRLACASLVACEEMLTLRFRPPSQMAGTGKAFEELRVRGRVRECVTDRAGRVICSVVFVEIDAYSREEIARFVHCTQLDQLRRVDSRTA